MKIFVLILFSFTIGCVSNPKKAKETAAIKKYTDKVKNYSSNERRAFKVKYCPTKKSLKNEKWNILLMNANACLINKKWKMVEYIGARLARKDSLSPWGPYYLSLAAENNKNIDKSFWMINLALKKAPQLGLLYYQRGRLYWKTKDFEQSLVNFNRSISLQVDATAANLFVGRIYLRDQNYSEAEKNFKIVLEKQQGNLLALKGMAHLYFETNKTNLAIYHLEKILRIQPKNTKLRIKLAKMYEMESNYSKSLNNYKFAKKHTLKPILHGVNLVEKINFLKTMVDKEKPLATISKKENGEN